MPQQHRKPLVHSTSTVAGSSRPIHGFSYALSGDLRPVRNVESAWKGPIWGFSSSLLTTVTDQMGKIDSVTCEHGHEDHNNAKNRMQAHQKQEINGLKKTHFAWKSLQSVWSDSTSPMKNHLGPNRNHYVPEKILHFPVMFPLKFPFRFQGILTLFCNDHFTYSFRIQNLRWI